MTAISCAKPRALSAEAHALYTRALDLWIERTIQLQTINQRIRADGAPICGEDLAPVLGVVATRAKELPLPLQRIGAERFRETTGLHVIAVIPGFPAARAGVEPGDRILRVGAGRAIGTANVHTPSETTARTIALRIIRGQRRIDLRLDNLPGCQFGAELVHSEAFNAYATRRKVLVCSGLMRILESDEPIAFVVGHEIAHYLEARRSWRDRVHGVAAEERADYVGAYLAARAGYQLTQGDFGLARPSYADPTRLAPRSRTHPSSPARIIAFESTLREIEEKRRDGLPLVPNGF